MAEGARAGGLGDWLSRRWLQLLIAALVAGVVGLIVFRRRRSRVDDAETVESQGETVSADDAEAGASAVTSLDAMGRRLLLLGIDALEAHVRQHFADLRLQAEDGPAAEPSQETTDS